MGSVSGSGAPRVLFVAEDNPDPVRELEFLRWLIEQANAKRQSEEGKRQAKEEW
jgi:hypothetical protein